MKVLLLSRYSRLGASSRYRSYQYLPFLTEKGVDVTVSAFSSDHYLQQLYSQRSTPVGDIARSYFHRFVQLRKARSYDLVWLEYEAMPWLPYFLESLLYAGLPYVVDYDDAIFHRYDQHPSPLVRQALGKKIDKVMRNAAVVIVGNEYLADHAHMAGAARVELVPTVVDISKYPKTPQPNNALFTIGWIGTPRTARYLESISRALQVVCGDGRAKLVIVGAPDFRIPGVTIEYKTWSEETEIGEMIKFDVGVMPLRDTPWERGKCGHKLIKYMASSRPVIASPVGVNRYLVEHGVTGFLAGEDQSEWVAAITSLREDSLMRERLGVAGRKKVEAAYCTAVTAPRLLQILCSATQDQ